MSYDKATDAMTQVFTKVLQGKYTEAEIALGRGELEEELAKWLIAAAWSAYVDDYGILRLVFKDVEIEAQ